MPGLRGVITDPLLSVVMPVYNERDTIEEIIGRVLSQPVRVELIVVDDGSKDGTRDILTRLHEQHGFKLIFQERNQGKGAALRRGFQEGLHDPLSPLAHRAMVGIAAVLLILPGFFTDALGLLLLLPPVRAVLIRGMASRMRGVVVLRRGSGFDAEPYEPKTFDDRLK